MKTSEYARKSAGKEAAYFQSPAGIKGRSLQKMSRCKERNLKKQWGGVQRIMKKQVIHSWHLPLIVYIFDYSLLISFTIEQIICGRYTFQRNDYNSCKHYRTNQRYCECRKSRNCKKRIICNL